MKIHRSHAHLPLFPMLSGALLCGHVLKVSSSCSPHWLCSPCPMVFHKTSLSHDNIYFILSMHDIFHICFTNVRLHPESNVPGNMSFPHGC